MENQKTIIALLCVIIALLAVLAIMFSPLMAKDASNLAIDDKEINAGDSLVVKLTDDNGNPIANETINIKLTDKDGITIDEKVTTNSKGNVNLKIEETGNYSVVCSFDGGSKYSSCSISENIKVEKPTTEVASNENSADVNNYPKYNPDLGYYRSTGIGQDEMGVVELAGGRYIVVAGDGYYEYGGQDAQGNIIRGSFLGHGGSKIY